MPASPSSCPDHRVEVVCADEIRYRRAGASRFAPSGVIATLAAGRGSMPRHAAAG